MKYVIFSIFLCTLVFINLLIIDNSYYFVTPIFMLNPNIYMIVSVVVFFIVGISIFLIYKDNDCSFWFFSQRLKIILIINFSLYFCYNVFTFKLVSPFLSFACKTFHFISSLYLNEEVIIQNKSSAKLLVPYILWTFYLTLVSISVFFINNS